LESGKCPPAKGCLSGDRAIDYRMAILVAGIKASEGSFLPSETDVAHRVGSERGPQQMIF